MSKVERETVQAHKRKCSFLFKRSEHRRRAACTNCHEPSVARQAVTNSLHLSPCDNTWH
jgi:hypothetical protein